MEAEDRTITLLGKSAPAGDRDVFGASLKGKEGEESYELSVPSRNSLLFACR